MPTRRAVPVEFLLDFIATDPLTAEADRRYFRRTFRAEPAVRTRPMRVEQPRLVLA